MKNVLKLALAAALVMACGSSYAQKMAYINMQEITMAMPEVDSVKVKLEKLGAEFNEQLEAIQVEYNNKYQDYSKNSANLSPDIRQLKEKELNDIRTRFAESQQALQASMEKSEGELMEPIVTKINEAIKKVCKANGIAVVFNTNVKDMYGMPAYYDESMLTDILPLVKKELGIQK